MVVLIVVAFPKKKNEVGNCPAVVVGDEGVGNTQNNIFGELVPYVGNENKHGFITQDCHIPDWLLEWLYYQNHKVLLKGFLTIK